MTFEFLIACRATSEADLYEILKGLLSEALENSQNEFEEDSMNQMIRIGHRRYGDEAVDDDGKTTRHAILGLTLELPEMDSVEAVVNDFAKSLSEPGPIFHVVRFEDPLLQNELARHATEIFALEMKLRRVLSFIYLHAYQKEEDTYNLLKEEQTKPVTQASISQQMKSATENQFFHITFSQYINLNNRPQLKLENLRSLIRDSENYDVLRSELLRSPIITEKDSDFLSDLQELMEPIEKMRNCVAHNRRPSRGIIENYLATLPNLKARLNDYLTGLEHPGDSGTLLG